MKKILTAVAGLIGCLFLFVGCGGETKITYVPGPDYEPNYTEKGTVEGLIQSADGALSGVKITLGDKTATSMRSGKFILRSTDLNGGKLTFSKDGYFDYRYKLEADDFKDGKAYVEVTLTQKASVSGTVKGSWGDYLGGVKVTSGGVETYTNEDGTYELDGVLAKDGILTFSKDGWGTITKLVRGDWFDESGKASGMDIEMHRTATLRGRVTDGKNGLAGVEVICGSARTVTDENGYYFLDGIFPENAAAHRYYGYHVEYKLDGYTTQVLTVDFVAAGYDTARDVILVK
ncbi:MAG: carboxypeptidase regulatory-like domain-containing protein [Clostridia bacterium]|nr:carboxypeptidase regulatory-like domain-containing protein [Clostridia bacterium]